MNEPDNIPGTEPIRSVIVYLDLPGVEVRFWATPADVARLHQTWDTRHYQPKSKEATCFRAPGVCLDLTRVVAITDAEARTDYTSDYPREPQFGAADDFDDPDDDWSN